MIDLLVLVIVAIIVAAALHYIRREKKRGVTCIGCPHAEDCAKRKQGGCGPKKG